MWIRPGGGVGEDYLAAVESLTGGSPELTVMALLGIFALAHSGLAGLRPYGECVSSYPFTGRQPVCAAVSAAPLGACALAHSRLASMPRAEVVSRLEHALACAVVTTSILRPNLTQFQHSKHTLS